MAAAVESLRAAEGDPDDPALRGRFVEQATAIARHGWDAFDAVLPLLGDADAVRRSAAAQILGRLAQADRTLAQTVCDSLIAVAAEEVDDGVVDTLAVAAHDAGLTVGAACNLLLRTPPLRRMGAYHLAMVVHVRPGGRAGPQGAADRGRRSRPRGPPVGRAGAGDGRAPRTEASTGP